MSPQFTLSILPEVFAVCRLSPDTPIPAWAAGGFLSLTRTAEELSIVCAQAQVPDSVKSEKGWRCLKVAGPLDLSLMGILAALTAPLAQAQIAIFAISTYDTDYLLVKEKDLEQAVHVLNQAGHSIQPD